MCNRIRPEDITAGVYTHINFAFGSIDASSFSVVPGGDRDVNLWRRMTAVRFNDPGVKIWLAIGGWTFNDEDQPTRMTFSDIAASESRQGQFFQSLIAIMQTYQFDGVDLDWYDVLYSARRKLYLHT
jgi:chitinase